MRCPTAKRMSETFRNLSIEQATLIRRLCLAEEKGAAALAALIEAECPETHTYARSCDGDPYASHMWRVTMTLDAIDRIMGTHGVEALGSVNMHKGPPYEYLNTGDPYVTTLIYCRAEDRIRIGCWGAYAERTMAF